ncbi:MAG: Gmad2 immunoglobulin-like domain-containing protein [Candidatus Kaiserbacteria bacterium]|nr:Gmad2 immunoglobulin-like domain-containing protein [Candidatus Kaiserbacteria bacterium]
MKKSSVIGAIFIIIAIGAVWFWTGKTNTQKVASDYKNITYIIQGQPVTLVNGRAESSTPGSASKTVTQYFGNEAVGDLTGDSVPDVAFILTQNTGGSGTFYYAVIAVNENGTYKGTNAMFLGDRIAPQTTEIHDGRAVVNFAERKPGEPMTAQPSVGKSVWIHLDVKNMEIGEWVKDFEGETDISRLIQVANPLPNQKVTSPLKVSGKAVGNWYFEASFPVMIVDANGEKLGVVPAQAQGEWMTTDLVPFEATLTFEKPATATGTVVFLKDNPSGLPENDNSISIPVSF